MELICRFSDLCTWRIRQTFHSAARLPATLIAQSGNCAPYTVHGINMNEEDGRLSLYFGCFEKAGHE